MKKKSIQTSTEVSPLSFLDRLSSPTPKFFKKLRNVGLILAAISGSILSAPISLPATVISTAGYLLVASGVLSAVSQSTLKVDP